MQVKSSMRGHLANRRVEPIEPHALQRLASRPRVKTTFKKGSTVFPKKLRQFIEMLLVVIRTNESLVFYTSAGHSIVVRIDEHDEQLNAERPDGSTSSRNSSSALNWKERNSRTPISQNDACDQMRRSGFGMQGVYLTQLHSKFICEKRKRFERSIKKDLLHRVQFIMPVSPRFVLACHGQMPRLVSPVSRFRVRIAPLRLAKIRRRAYPGNVNAANCATKSQTAQRPRVRDTIGGMRRSWKNANEDEREQAGGLP